MLILSVTLTGTLFSGEGVFLVSLMRTNRPDSGMSSPPVVRRGMYLMPIIVSVCGCVCLFACVCVCVGGGGGGICVEQKATIYFMCS